MIVDGRYQWEIFPFQSLAVNCWDAGVGEATAFESFMAAYGGAAAEGGAAATGTVGAAGATAAGGVTAAGVAAGATVLAAGTSIYSALNAPKLSGFVSSPTSSQDTEAAAYAQMSALRSRRGAASTILTGPLGVTSPGQTSRATLGT